MYVPLTWMTGIDVYGINRSINISVPVILWDWRSLLFMKFTGLLDCHPEIRIRKQFGIKRVMEWDKGPIVFSGVQILLESSDVFGSRAM